MRSRTKITLAAAVAALTLSGTLVAYGHEEGWGHGPWGGHSPISPVLGAAPFATLFEQVDVDHDGKLTKAELDAYAADVLRRFDKDGDGQVSLDEFQGLWLELTRPMEVRAFQFVDGDGDAKLTAQELQRPLDHLFERLDRKGDGFITKDELPGPGGPSERHGHDSEGD